MQQQKENELAYFNLLKFIGALVIALLLHYNDHFLRCLGIENPFRQGGLLWSLSYQGGVFVEMYFIISGILFAYVYRRKIKDGMHFSEFFRKRIIRIFPLLILTSIIMYIANALLYHLNGTLWSYGTLNLWDLCGDILFGGKAIFNADNTLNGPIWYVNVLLLCYVVAFLLSKLSQKCNTRFVFLIPIILGLMMYYSGHSCAGWNLSIARGYIAFFIGVLLADVMHYWRQLSIKMQVGIRVVLALELLAVIALYFSPWGEMTVMASLTNVCAFLVFPEVILLLYNLKGLNKICNTKPIQWLGNLSFGIYLWNFPIYICLHILIVGGLLEIDVTSGVFLFIVAALHIALAGLAHYLIDKKLCACFKRKQIENP